MRDDGLFYPEDPAEAFAHALAFARDLVALHGHPIDSSDLDPDNAWHRMTLSSPGRAELIAALEDRMAGLGRRAWSHDADVLPYRLLLIALKLDGAIEKGELDVALEAFEALLQKLSGERRNSQHLWERYFWPR